MKGNLKKRLYRAYFSHMPLGNVMEKVWYMNRLELWYDGFRAGRESAVKERS